MYSQDSANFHELNIRKNSPCLKNADFPNNLQETALTFSACVIIESTTLSQTWTDRL